MWPLLELKGGQPEVWFSKEVRVQNVLRALLCICGSIDHKGGRDKRWKRNPSPIHGLRGHVCSNAPLGPLLVVPLISKRKSTFWRDWSVKKKTPCCKHSPSSISMLLRIVRKGGRLYTQPGRFILRRDCSSLTQLQSQMNVFHSGLALHAITDSLLNLCPLNDIPFKLSNVGCCLVALWLFFLLSHTWIVIHRNTLVKPVDFDSIVSLSKI